MSVERALGAMPVAVSSFVGRERQLVRCRLPDRDVPACHADRRRRLRKDPPGAGDRQPAATPVRRRCRPCPASPLGDPSFVAPAVGRALGMLEAPGRSYREAVALALRDRELLLVLDNFEHLIGAAPLVAEWLMACPGLTVLTTSRERLRLQGEQVYPVPPLRVAVRHLSAQSGRPAAEHASRSRLLPPHIHDPRGGPIVCRSSAGSAARLCAFRAVRTGRRRDMPPPGRATACDRAGRCSGLGAAARDDAGATRPALARSRQWVA